MPSPRRRSKRRRAQRGRRKRRASSWRRLFDVLTHRGVVGGIWIIAALLCVLVVALEPMSLASPQDWTRAYSHPDMARALAIAMVLGLAGLVGLFWRRWQGDDSPDRTVDESPPVVPGQVWPPRLGVILLGLGTVFLAGHWLHSHHQVTAGELVMPVDKTHESVTVTQGDRKVQIKLPMRTTVHDIELGEAPRIWVQFARPDFEIAYPDREQLREFSPGQSLDVEGMRFVFSGFATAHTTKRVVLSTTGENPDVVTAAVGDRVQIGASGPTVRVVDAVDQYLDVFMPAPGISVEQGQLMALARGYPLSALGPAVQLEDGQGQTFWVFARGGQLVDESPHLGVSLQVDEIRELPAAVMTTTTVRPSWPFAIGMILIVVGAMLLLVFPERVVRRRDEEEVTLWSFNQIDALSMSAGSGDGEQSIWGGNFARFTALIAIGALGLSIFVGATPAGVLAMAGLVAAIGLPRDMGSSPQRRALLVAAMIPMGLVMGAIFAFQGLMWSVAPASETVLWTAQMGSWLAMATALIAAGVLAEKTLERVSTQGGVTVALSLWAAMASVVAVGFQRGRATGDGMALPLTSEAGEALWTIPDLAATADLRIAVVGASEQIAFVAGAVALFATFGVVGEALSNKKLSLGAWGATFLAAGAGLLQMLGVAQPHWQPDPANYERLARQWLQSRELPGWIADSGGFQVEGALTLNTTALAPEIIAFSIALLLAAAMIAVTALGHKKKEENPDPLAGRDLFFRALIFGLVGWSLGLVLAWEYLGSPGVLAAMEWLGLSVALFALGVLLLGWRRGPSVAERWIRALGPALVVGYLIVVVAIGAFGGTAPGTSIPFLQ